MRAVVQRVSRATVTIDDRVTGEIGRGLLVLLGVGQNDNESDAEYCAEKICGLRIFEDDQGKMNRSLADTGGGLLLVSQFTLAADTGKGMRPSFTSAASPDAGRRWFERLVELARAHHSRVEIGRFGAHMEVSLVNDGPVTFWLEAP